MYTATMLYSIKEDYLKEAQKLWKTKVMDLAEQQEGFIRMQFLSNNKNKAMAIGTWKEKKYAENFMKKGVFKELMEDMWKMLTSEPQPTIWDLKHYSEK